MTVRTELIRFAIVLLTCFVGATAARIVVAQFALDPGPEAALNFAFVLPVAFVAHCLSHPERRK
jgi:hypothetical protein